MSHHLWVYCALCAYAMRVIQDETPEHSMRTRREDHKYDFGSHAEVWRDGDKESGKIGF